MRISDLFMRQFPPNPLPSNTCFLALATSCKFPRTACTPRVWNTNLRYKNILRRSSRFSNIQVMVIWFRARWQNATLKSTGNLLTWPMPDLDLFLQVWIGIPIFMVVVSAYLVFAPFYDAPLQSFYCLLFVSAGIPFYLVFVRHKVAPPSFLRFVGKPLLISLHFN